MDKKTAKNPVVWIDIEDLADIGPVRHVEYGEENWYLTAVNAYKKHPAGQKYFIKIL